MTDPTASTIPPSSSTPFTSAAGGVTLEAIMVQPQQMEANFGGCLDYLIDEMCQMNTQIGRIARKQACMVGFFPSPSPSLEALVDEGDDADDDEDDASSFGNDEDDVSSFGDDEMTTSQ